MSADNTIGILITKRSDGQPGQEYRVGYAQAIENAWEEPDYPGDKSSMHRATVRRIWAKSPVYTDAGVARKAAVVMEVQQGYVEYGIVVYDHPNLFFPASPAKSRRNRMKRRPR